MPRYVIVRQAPLPPNEFCYLTSSFDHGTEMDVWSADQDSALIFPDHESANSFLTISEIQNAQLIPILDIPSPEYKKPGNIVYRFISGVVLIFVVVPLFLLNLIVEAPFEIVNNFTYHNYRSYVLPDYLLEKVGTGFTSIGFYKIWMNLLSPIIMIYYNFIAGIKTLKF